MILLLQFRNGFEIQGLLFCAPNKSSNYDQQIKKTSNSFSWYHFFVGCNKDDNKPSSSAKDPNTAEPAFIDRFSSTAGHLQVRTATNNLPAANGKTSK